MRLQYRWWLFPWLAGIHFNHPNCFMGFCQTNWGFFRKVAKSFLSEKLAVVLLRAAPWSLMRQNLLKIWVPENPAKQTSFFFFVFFCFFKRTVHRLQSGFERISTINLEKTNMLRRKKLLSVANFWICSTSPKAAKSFLRFRWWPGGLLESSIEMRSLWVSSPFFFRSFFWLLPF